MPLRCDNDYDTSKETAQDDCTESACQPAASDAFGDQGETHQSRAGRRKHRHRLKTGMEPDQEWDVKGVAGKNPRSDKDASRTDHSHEPTETLRDTLVDDVDFGRRRQSHHGSDTDRGHERFPRRDLKTIAIALRSGS